MKDQFKFYTANVREDFKNCIYPNEVIATTEEELKSALSKDYVAAKYKRSYRNKDNFIETEMTIEDCDNDDSDDPETYINPEDMQAIFPGVTMFIHFSRNHMKEKHKKEKVIGPRSRFHVGFPIRKITDAEEFTRFKQNVQDMFPFFDGNAKDAARFMVGTENPEVIIIKGNRTLDEYISEIKEEKEFAELDEKPKAIPQGSRNATMHRIAVKLLIRYGNNNDTKRRFIKENERCDPPLEVEELKTIWNSASKFFRKKVAPNPNYISQEQYNGSLVKEVEWEEPLPFTKPVLPEFPVNALPKCIADYVYAVAETTQTPVDMAATSSLAILSLCMQGKYDVQAKPDWTEPTNLFCLIIAEPSERKSAIVSLMSKVLDRYEIDYNTRHSAIFEFSKMEKQSLESKKKSFETQYVKGKKTKEEMQELAQEIAEFKEKLPKKLYVDNITSEKLTSVIANNEGKMAILSSEAGIFNIMAGMYNEKAEIDVFLKAYSGDSIRVDRMGRPSELISHPALTMLLLIQPSVLVSIMKNSTFEGRGLTTRFLYSIPKSFIGKRRYKTDAIPKQIMDAYEDKIVELLKENEDLAFEQTTLLLTPEASDLLENYFDENEKAMVNENQEIKSWSGKLVGNVLRISAIIARASQKGLNYFLEDNPKMYVTKEHMESAIAIGRYFTEHAKAAHSLMGLDPVIKQCEYILEKIKSNGMKEFTLRELGKKCRSFKDTASMKPAINKLTEFGYIQPRMEGNKPSANHYLSNPVLFTENVNANKEENNNA